MPISILDLAVIGVVLISALLAAVRGFTREVLAIFAWVAAAAAAWFLHPLLLPIVKQHISNPTVALAAALGGIFIVTLIVVSIITVKVSDLILDSRIGAIDRTLGFVFGAGRGLLICVIGWVFLAWLVQGQDAGVGERSPVAADAGEHRQRPRRHAAGEPGRAPEADPEAEGRRTGGAAGRGPAQRASSAAARLIRFRCCGAAALG